MTILLVEAFQLETYLSDICASLTSHLFTGFLVIWKTLCFGWEKWLYSLEVDFQREQS